MMRPAVALAAATLLLVTACGGDAGTAQGGPGGASPSAGTTAVAAEATPSPTPVPTADPGGEMCLHLAEMEERLRSLREVELRLPNRVALEIELDKVMAAYGELADVDLGDREEELERSLTRLGYRLDELELAVEDFHTNFHPRQAGPHVEEDAEKVAEELAALVILSRC